MSNTYRPSHLKNLLQNIICHGNTAGTIFLADSFQYIPTIIRRPGILLIK